MHIHDNITEYDIKQLNLWLAGYRGDITTLDCYTKRASTYTPISQKHRFSTTRVAGGICLDCERQRCPTCNGCSIDVYEKVKDEAHCQRCICYHAEKQKALNETGIPLDELVKTRQGTGFNDKLLGY
jgi:hypothetical protein